jgi:uncharacterized membrane protein HdeD (DUF308 family)
VSSYAGGRGEALPWGLVLVEGIVVALLGLVLLVAPGASLVFLVQLLGIYLLIAGIFRIIGIFLDSSSWGWKLAAGILCLIAGLAILSNPLWSTTLASTGLVILVGFLVMLQGAAGLIVAFQGGGWGMGVLSVLGILLGLILVINPLIGVAALTFILAIFMLIGGVGAVIQAFRMRREAAAQQPGRCARASDFGELRKTEVQLPRIHLLGTDVKIRPPPGGASSTRESDVRALRQSSLGCLL